MTKKIDPPSKTTGDFIHAAINASAGAVPIAGSFLSEIFLNVIVPPYEKRKEEWMKDVANRIEEIDMKVNSFKPENLKDNDNFLDAMISATKAAIATSSIDKRAQLLNALQNVALTKNNDKITNMIFLNFIDKFTDAHMCICRIMEIPNDFRLPRGQFDTKETYRELINKKLPEIDNDIINIIVKELHDSGLITIDASRLDSHPPFMEEGTPQLSELGKQFLQFITKPDLGT